MKYTTSTGPRYAEITFDAKPSAPIISALKANGFRWNRRSWWRGRVTGFADFLAWLDKELNPGRPDGKCWKCGDPNGFFRNHGAATPVYCAKCHADDIAHETAEADPMGVDLAYEDSCRETCGL